MLSSPMSRADEEELTKSLEELLKEEDQEQVMGDKRLPSVPSNQFLPKDSISDAAATEHVSDDIANAFLALQLDDLGK